MNDSSSGGAMHDEQSNATPQDVQRGSRGLSSKQRQPQRLPKCFCNWGSCRSLQKEFNATKHPYYAGIIKFKFWKHDHKSMALKEVVERCLGVDARRREEWRDFVTDDGETLQYCRFYVANHHYTQQLIYAYQRNRSTWDWSEPLDAQSAKELLYDRTDPYYSDDEESGDEDQARYVLTPNVPRQVVREALQSWYDELDRMHQSEQTEQGQQRQAEQFGEQPVGQQQLKLPQRSREVEDEDDDSRPSSVVVKSPTGGKSGGGASQHTQSTLSTSVTDHLQNLEAMSLNGTIADQSSLASNNNSHSARSRPHDSTAISGVANTPVGSSASSVPSNTSAANTAVHDNTAVNQLHIAQHENQQLRQQISMCQEQIEQLKNMVQNLTTQVQSSSAEPQPAGPTPPPPSRVVDDTLSSVSQKTGTVRRRRRRNNVDDASGNNSRPDESESEEGWSETRLNAAPSDDDETISTLHVTYNANRSSHSRHGSRHSVRGGSARSKRSVRRDSIHSRRNSIHSKRSMRGGGDDMSVMSRQSIQSTSPSMKSLPREIELMDDDDDDDGAGRRNNSRSHRGGSRHNTRGGGSGVGDDDYSFFDDSRSVGSRSAASRRSRPSFVSGRNRNNRGGNTNRFASSGKAQASVSNPGTATTQSVSTSSRGSGRGGSSVPSEIDFSGDEMEDETYANVSNDTQYVENHKIVDPYGEKGVYTGAMSKSTLMPNGKGKLEYEKSGRWYEGDWCHGRWTGFGRLSNGDGDFYEGGLKNDHKHGRGKMKFSDGRIFEGEYVRGQMVEGKMTYQDGSVYNGAWFEGMRHGMGKCVFVDGSEYEGEFRVGSFHGHGKMTWNDGGWYIGQWCEGEMDGIGKEVRADGTLRHEGEWSRGQPIRDRHRQERRRRRRK